MVIAQFYHYMQKKNVFEKPLVFLFVAYLLLFFFTCNNGFFWDTIHLASLQAWWYYDNNFAFFFLPGNIDSGHPSYFAMLLALLWKIFQPSLLVGHLMMLPFIILLIVEVVKSSKYYFPENWPFVASLILFNPIILTQSTLVSPDVLLVCFFFFTLNGILQNSFKRILIGALLLGAISMRGMMCIPYLFIFGVFKSRVPGVSILRMLLSFTPGAFLAFLFLLMHYIQKGWVGYHEGSPWAASFEGAGVSGFFRNVLVFFWRLFDLGMVFMWLTTLVLTLKAKFNFSKRTKELLLLGSLCFLFSILLQFFYKYSLLHRYLFPFIAIMILVFCSVLEETVTSARFKRNSCIALIFLIAGNFWIYPDRIAKSWDATLAHLPYYKLRKEALEYLDQTKLSLSRVSGSFPYYETGKCLDLTSDTVRYSQADPEIAEYILYSNISNDFSDTQLLFLKEECIPVKTFGKWPVRFVLYRNPGFNK